MNVRSSPPPVGVRRRVHHRRASLSDSMWISSGGHAVDSEKNALVLVNQHVKWCSPPRLAEQPEEESGAMC